MNAEDMIAQEFIWKINSAAVGCKETKTQDAETIYVPGGMNYDPARLPIVATSLASGNGFVHTACFRMTGLTQTDESTLFVVAPITMWPHCEWSNVTAKAIRSVAKTKTCNSRRPVIRKHTRQPGRVR
jgi:hypothetical protein